MNKPAWSRRLSLLLVFSGLIQLLSFAVRPTLSYAAIEAGGPTAVLGIIAAAMAIPALFLALPSGRLVDKAGERPAMVLGAALLVVSCLVAAAAGSIPLLLAATVIFGLGHLLTVVGSQVVTGNLDDGRSLDSRFGLYSFASSIGQTVGPLLLLLPGGTGAAPPILLIFLTCAGLSVGMLVLGLGLHSSAPKSSSAKRPKMGAVTSQLLRTRGIPRALFASAVVLASIDLFVAYLPALGQERGVTAQMVAVMLTVRSLMSVFSRLFLTSLLRLLGRRTLLISTIGTAALMLVLLWSPLPVWGYLLVAAVYGFAIGPCQPVTMAWVSELSPVTARGTAMALRLAGNRLAQSALPAALGAFAAAAGAGGVLAITGVVLGTAALASTTAEGKKQ